MSTYEIDDYFVGEESPAPLSVLRAEAKCLCMTHWGETDETHCTIDPRVTEHNIRMLQEKRTA